MTDVQKFIVYCYDVKHKTMIPNRVAMNIARAEEIIQTLRIKGINAFYLPA